MSKIYGYKIWKGTSNEYKKLHRKINQIFGQPPACEYCGTIVGIIEWANISGEYLEVRKDWRRLCRKCHMHEDGRAFSKPATGLKHTEATKAKIAASLRLAHKTKLGLLNNVKEGK